MKLRCEILFDIAKGLGYLHTLELPLVHNDLRSPNIFVRPGLLPSEIMSVEEDAAVHAKVADFGLARFAAGKLRMLRRSSWRLFFS